MNDNQGIRTSKTVGGVLHTYVTDGSRVLVETWGNNTIFYTYDLSGKVISATINGTEYFYQYNIQGDVTALALSTGVIVVRYVYDAWGNVVAMSGSLSSTIGEINPVRYRGYMQDSETGFHYLQSRYYDPMIGRFISSDGWLGEPGMVLSHNMYVYALNNPVMYSDISGYAPEWLENIGGWFVEHKTEIIIGTAFIVLGILSMGVATAIGGAGLAAVMSTMGSAALSSAINVGISMGISAIICGTVAGTSGNGFWNGFTDGLASGYMWGGVFAGSAQVLSGVMKITRHLAPNYNGQYIGKLKLWSPNASGNPNVGGTMMKFGRYNRIDVEARRLMHIAWRVGGYNINHIPAGTIISGIIGGFD